MKQLLLIYILIFMVGSLWAQSTPRPAEPTPGVAPQSSYPANNWLKNSVPPHFCTAAGATVPHPYDWEPRFLTTNTNSVQCYDGIYFRMPFFRVLGSGATENQDLFPLQPKLSQMQETFVPDYLPEEGWELVSKLVGTIGQGVNTPFYIFYNKYEAKLRVFAILTKTYMGSNDANLCLYFKKDLTATNLLSASKQPMEALDSYSDYREDKETLCQIMKWVNNGDRWVYADYPMTYDPCTCLFTAGVIEIKVTIQTVSNIALGNAENVKDITNHKKLGNKPNPSENDYSSSIESQVKQGMKSFKEIASSFEALQSAIDKIGSPADKDKANKQKTDYFGTAAKYAKLIPAYGDAAYAVIGLIDFFSGSSSADKSSPPFALTNANVNLTGTITQVFTKDNISFPLPGSYESEQLQYNYPLGNFNILKKPKLICRRGSESNGCYTSLGNANQDELQEYMDYFFYLKEPLQVVVNPWPGFDFSKSRVNASIELEHSAINSNLFSYSSWIVHNQKDGFHKWEVEYPKKDFGSFEYITSSAINNDLHYNFSTNMPNYFYENGTLKSSTYPIDFNYFNTYTEFSKRYFRLKLGKDYLPEWGRYHFEWRDLRNFDNYTTMPGTPDVRAFIKFSVELKGPQGKNYQYIVRYPADIDFLGPFDRCPDGADWPYMNDHIKPYYTEVAADKANPDPNAVFRHPNELPVDLDLTGSQIVGSRSVYRALNSVNVIGTIQSPAVGSPAIHIQAPNIAINGAATGDIVLQPGVILENRDFTNPTGITGIINTPRSDINTFCNSNTYKVAPRSTQPFRVKGESDIDSKPNNTEKPAMLLVPNPAGIQDAISVTVKSESVSSIHFNDALGRNIPITVSGAEGTYEIRHTATSPGVYILSVTTPQGMLRKRVVLQ